ncbi:ATPase SWSAP1 [Ornithorhynchus anatinus]|uniref:ATPase SWSAP1 n=1 Tax=Ornithorhynchus anatinus TaxID=9258 RepID=UPI0010A8AA93|nr:ATPase SWSAP1 [Ornithorhynchus anatinus]
MGEASVGVLRGAGPSLLVVGEPGSGKTALLFAAALEAAGEGRGPVVFVARSPLQSLPRVPGWAVRDPLRLQKIRFLYPHSSQELLQLVSSMHETPSHIPSLLLLDGLDEYLTECNEQPLATHLTALLVDTATYFSEKLGPGHSEGAVTSGFSLIVSVRPSALEEEASLQTALLERYFPMRCWLEPEEVGTQESEQFSFRTRFSGWHRLGSQDQKLEWRLGFGPDGEMRISLFS